MAIIKYITTDYIGSFSMKTYVKKGDTVTVVSTKYHGGMLVNNGSETFFILHKYLSDEVVKPEPKQKEVKPKRLKVK